MDIRLWCQILREAVYWQKLDDGMCLDLLQRTAMAWRHDQSYFMQSGPGRVDLTKLYEQYKLIEIIKGTDRDQEINSEHC
jgi:hypothetical protein